MHTVEELKKQQVGLRLHSYLIEEIDELSKEFSVNRSDIIEEAIRAYLQEQKAKMLYDEMENSIKELKEIKEGESNKELDTLEEFINELENS
jgi:metal-responsive CopG/Arc/MetJ family transcriptional regulator